MTISNSKNALALAYFQTSQRIHHHLNKGMIESASISEALVVDTPELLELMSPEGYTFVKTLFDRGDSIYKFYEIAAIGLLTAYGPNGYKDWIYHSSDTVRCWVAYWIAYNTQLNFHEQLKQMEPLINDPHFWVRENACMAMRPLLLHDLDDLLELLESCAHSENPNMRRFTVEITRPKGFWTTPIQALQQHPEKALPLLEALRTDKDKYVQESLINWFMDAEDFMPGWSKNILDHWCASTMSLEPSRIYKKVFQRI